jgi:hypothetical protein
MKCPDPKIKAAIAILWQHSSRTANLGEWRHMLFAGDPRVGFKNTIAKRNPHGPRRDTVEANSSLVSGFDSSTENRTHFKVSGDKNFLAPFLVKVIAKVNAEVMRRAIFFGPVRLVASQNIASPSDRLAPRPRSHCRFL